MKRFFFLSILFLTLSTNAQVIGGKLPGLKKGGDFQGISNDSLNKHKRTKKSEVTYPVNKYKIFHLDSDSIHIDTVLSIRNYYKLNYILQDDFEYLPFHNMGEGFNYLSSGFLDKLVNIIPGFVASAKDFNLIDQTKIPFFKVPTTYSDLFYLSGIGQGQMLNSLITTNLTPDLNFAIGYKGVNSLGLYKNSQTSLGRFLFSSNFNTKNKRYFSKLFFVSYNLYNQENGGLLDPILFESGDPAYTNRSRMEVKFIDAETKKYSNQFFWRQSYRIIDSKNISIENDLNYNTNKFIYSQSAPSEYIGEAFSSGKILDSVRLKKWSDYVSVKFLYGGMQLKSGVGYLYNRYQWDSIKNISGHIIPDKLFYKDLSWKSEANWKYKKLHLQVNSEVIPTQDLQGYSLRGKVYFKIDTLSKVSVSLLSSSRKPDFKYILFQSGYTKYNWYHPEFDNVRFQQVRASISHKKWGKISFKQQAINNYTYFGTDSLPHQFSGLITISSLKLQNDAKWKKIGVSSDILYQKILKGEEIISLPSIVLRETLYFNDRYFKKHLYIQTGISIKYFSSYYAPGYLPITGDYFIQREQKIGDFPLLDFFFNFKVKRFRFYFKAEHINALWEIDKPNYYVAPDYPMRDFTLRFGINWVFFN
jgi:hypothetical protein